MLDAFYDASGEDSGWFEVIRRAERERRLELDFSAAFIEEFRGQAPFPRLLKLLELERARYRSKEALLRTASEARREETRRGQAGGEAAAQAEEAHVGEELAAADEEREVERTEERDAERRADEAMAASAWSDELAPRVARQLIFAFGEADGSSRGAAPGDSGAASGLVVPARSQPPQEESADWSVRAGVARLGELLDAAGGGDLEAALVLRELAGLTEQLEDLQRRRRGGAAQGQRELEEERRELVQAIRACATERPAS